MIVVDTNIISYLLISNEKFNTTADELYRRDKIWIAPNLWQHEFKSVLGGYLKKNIMNRSEGIGTFEHALSLVETRDYQDSESIFKIMEFSRLSSYDCTFIAFASSLELQLVTEDKKILNEFPYAARCMSGFLDG